MKKAAFLTILLVTIFSVFAFGQNKFDGLWGGTIESSGLKLDVNFEVQSGQDRVLLSVPMQKINEQVGMGLEISGDSIYFDYSNYNAKYKGAYDAETDQIIGQWTQGKSTQLNLKKVKAKSKIVRTQEVKPPFDYDYKNIKFHNEEAQLDLAATLTIPNGDGPFPMAILISGSGPQDRNSELLEHKPFLVIADHLSSNGIAVLRYDDRGVKNSEGSFINSTTEDFASDAAAAIKYAESLDFVDKDKIGFIGHSEGGMIAPMVAANYGNVDFIVSVAGPAVPITELMAIQNKLIFEKLGMSDKGLRILENRLPGIYNIVNQDKEPNELFDTLIREVKSFYEELPKEDQPLLGQSSTVYYTTLSTTFFTKWFRYFLAYDPGPSWQKVTCPVLAMNGSKDIQVSSKENLAAIKKNLEIAENKNFKIVELEGFNHLMQKCEFCSIQEYASIETTFDPKALDLITNFLKSL